MASELASQRARSPASETLRLLSVGCATGEEPYSMAIAAAHAGWPPDRLVVDAVDRVANRLATAREARYARRSLRSDAPTWSRPWLRVRDDEVTVSPRIVASVRWIKANVLADRDPLTPNRYQVICCRNLLIYLHEKARAQLVERLSAWLASDGLLLVGHAERLREVRGVFTTIPKPKAFALRHPSPEAVSRRPALPPPPAHPPPTLQQFIQSELPTSDPGSPPRVVEAQRHLVEEDAAAALTTRPHSLESLQKMADRGDLDEALRGCDAAIEASSPQPALFALKGNVLLGLDQFERARDMFQKALYLDPQHETSLLQLSIIYRRLGDRRQAKQYARRAARAHRQPAEDSRT
jgi:chemotaxis protein methyltransferase WspC